MEKNNANALLTLGTRLRRRRMEAGLTVGELAQRTHMQADAVEAYEDGAGNLGTAQLLRIAKALEIDAGQLLHTSREEKSSGLTPTAMLRSKGLDTTLDEADLNAISEALRKARNFSQLGKLLRTRRACDEFQPEPPPPTNAWVAGYDLAERVRRLLPERSGAIKNVWRLLEETFDILVIPHAFSNARIDGAACRAGAARVIVLNSRLRFEAYRRMVLAHELAHHLVDLKQDDATTDESGPRGFSMEKSPAEKRADAFAAMFLAPERELRRLLGEPGNVNVPGSKAKEFVARVRAEFGLGPEAMTRHLQHLRYLSPAVAEQVMREVSGQEDALAGFEDEPPYNGLERRVGAALDADLISRGRARELLGLSPFDDNPIISAS